MDGQSPIQNGSPPNWVCIPAGVAAPEENLIDFGQLLGTIWRWKWGIGGFTLVCTLIAVYVTLFVMPVKFTSDASIQPTESSNPQLSGLLAASAQFLPIPLARGNDKSRVMLNYLESRALQAWMIEKYNLRVRMYPDLWDAEQKKWRVDDPKQIPSLAKMLQRNVVLNTFGADKDKDTGLITIYFIDEDPVFAAKVVSGTIEKLDQYLTEEYITDAKRNRIFIEEQLARATKLLEDWEKKVPSQDLTASKIERERMATTAVYQELRRQYELAKIEEDKQLVSFRVLDQPLVPAFKSEPQRSKICLATMIVSAFMAFILIMLWEYFRGTLMSGNGTAPDPQSEQAHTPES